MDGPSPRVAKETKTLANDPVPGIICTPDGNNYKHFFVVIEGTLTHDLGPGGTCFEGGKFQAELLLPDDYPMSPPKVVFDTKIYHPNIGIPESISLDNLGRICLDILKKNWSPALQIKSVLLSIQSLLSEPNPDDPLNNEAAEKWKTNKTAAEAQAREWTGKYAH